MQLEQLSRNLTSKIGNVARRHVDLPAAGPRNCYCHRQLQRQRLIKNGQIEDAGVSTDSQYQGAFRARIGRCCQRCNPVIAAQHTDGDFLCKFKNISKSYVADYDDYVSPAQIA
jgi:hypothetical protein